MQTGSNLFSPTGVKVIIDPSSRIYYSSFYIQGFYDLLSKRNVRFSGKPFTALDRSASQFAFEHYFAFAVVFPDGRLRKVVVDFCDPPDIDADAYKWCDVYAKINFNAEATDPFLPDKILVIPPSFGINIWGSPKTYCMLASNLAKCRFRPIAGLKRFVQDYRFQLNRLQLGDYDQIAQSANDYVFMIATLWSDNESLNLYRKKFIDAVKSKCTFEGGFFSREIPKASQGWNDYVISRPYAMADYVAKTKRSAFVFNTPAVHGCHGWKLGEYLAMGKAILCTPLNNEITPALKHGKQVHFVSGIDDIGQAITELLAKPEYRKTLEQNAKKYFRSEMSPAAVVAKIIEKAYGKQ